MEQAFKVASPVNASSSDASTSSLSFLQESTPLTDVHCVPTCRHVLSAARPRQHCFASFMLGRRLGLEGALRLSSHSVHMSSAGCLEAPFSGVPAQDPGSLIAGFAPVEEVFYNILRGFSADACPMVTCSMNFAVTCCAVRKPAHQPAACPIVHMTHSLAIP